MQKKEKREAIEENRRAAFLERKINAEETANKIKMELEERMIRENRAIEEYKLKMELKKASERRSREGKTARDKSKTS